MTTSDAKGPFGTREADRLGSSRLGRSEFTLAAVTVSLAAVAFGVTEFVAIRPLTTSGVAVGLLLVAYGLYLGHEPPGSVLGFKNQATLASGRVWRTTHRLSQYLLGSLGIAVMAGALSSHAWWWIAVGGYAGIMVILTRVSSAISGEADPSNDTPHTASTQARA